MSLFSSVGRERSRERFMRRDEFVPFPRMVSGKRLSLALDALEALETGKAAVRDRCRGRVGSGHGETPGVHRVRVGSAFIARMAP